MNRSTMAACAAATLAVALAAPRPAAACGGFFCNRSMPMNQAGEKIVFSVEDDGTTTTHVQILYSGSAAGFAWILPVPAVPELSVGTDLLFRELESATMPQFRMHERLTGVCRQEPGCSDDRDVADGVGWADGSAPAADAGSGGVTVHLRQVVGPYDAAVISSDEPMAVQTWLADNDYDIPEAAGSLIGHYVEKRDFFVALKLLADRTAGEVQPIVLRYRERQPCIPIRLTAIATVPDKPITAWVLAEGRAAPYNYLAIAPDLNDPGLWLGGTSYTTVVSQAVDDAGGRAFVTDYAGAVPSLSVAAPGVEDLRTQTNPAAFVRDLSVRFPGDGQLLAILLRHIPPPEGVSPNDFYNCLASGCDGYDEHLASLAFEPSALVDALNEAIVSPRNEAQAMLGRHPKLTRLFTTMSAEEMTEDPVFVVAASMPDVSNVHVATRVTECGPDYLRWSAPKKLILPNGGEHRISEGVPYRGSDAEYCEDRAAGVFAPWTPVDVLRQTAERRATKAGGGGGCSIAAPGSASAGLPLLALALLCLGRRRNGRRKAGGMR